MKHELLSTLWDLTVRSLISRIESGDHTAQDLNIARQLLRDHGMTVDKPEETPIASLYEILPFQAEEETKTG